MRLLFPILLLAFPFLASAQIDREPSEARTTNETAPIAAPANDPAEPETRVTRIRENSSEHHRLDKRFQVTGEVGLPTFPLPTAGPSAAVFLDRNSLLDIDYTRANNSWLGYKVEIVMGGVHYQRFLTNSFYLKAGVDYRMMRFYDSWDWLFGGSSTGEFARHDSIGPSFAVGNQWQFEHFVIGCDWGGVYVPAVILKDEFNSANVAYSDSDDADRGWKSAKRAAIMAVRLHVGVSW